jgi:DNA-binding HxlR family transcriptional regulator
MHHKEIAGSLIEVIETRWTLRILLGLRAGEQRFSDLKAVIPRISPNVLIKRIRALESAGLVECNYLPPPSARHVYSLTPSANALRPALDALATWQAEACELPLPIIGKGFDLRLKE